MARPFINLHFATLRLIDRSSDHEHRTWISRSVLIKFQLHVFITNLDLRVPNTDRGTKKTKTTNLGRAWRTVRYRLVFSNAPFRQSLLINHQAQDSMIYIPALRCIMWVMWPIAKSVISTCNTVTSPPTFTRTWKGFSANQLCRCRRNKTQGMRVDRNAVHNDNSNLSIPRSISRWSALSKIVDLIGSSSWYSHCELRTFIRYSPWLTPTPDNS